MEDISERDIQHYILYLKKERGLSAGTINNYISAVKLFYTFVLDKEWNPKKIPRMKRLRTFPFIPPKEDVLTILAITTNLKHKAILSLIYGSGLRVSEVAKLKISDICSKTMRVRVDQAKHSTNRYTILSEVALDVLRTYFRAYFPSKSYRADDWLSRRTHFGIVLQPMPWKMALILYLSSRCLAIRDFKAPWSIST